jgi:hypothetical protein
MFGRDRLPADQEKPRRQRHVQKDMGEKNPPQTIDADRRQTQHPEQSVDNPRTPENGEQPQDSHDHRQDEGRAKQRDQGRASGKAAARQCPGHGNGKKTGEQGGKDSLHQRETKDGDVRPPERKAVRAQQERHERSEAKGEHDEGGDMPWPTGETSHRRPAAGSARI